MSLDGTWPMWPKALVPAEWNKQKGVIAKLVKGETGVGAKLDEAWTAYHAVGVGHFSDHVVEVTDKASCTKHLAEAKKQMGNQVKACFVKLSALESLAETKAKEFGKNPVVPKSSRMYLEQMRDSAKKLKTEVRSFCETSITDMEKALKKLG